MSSMAHLASAEGPTGFGSVGVPQQHTLWPSHVNPPLARAAGDAYTPPLSPLAGSSYVRGGAPGDLAGVAST